MKCNEPDTDSCHDVTPNDIINKVLRQYAVNKKKYRGDRNGIRVSCDVNSNNGTISNSKHWKLCTSIRPDESVKFKFKVLNETNAENILVVGIMLATTKLNFKMNKHPFVLGEDPYNLSPKQAIPKDITVMFSSSIIGEYHMPIMFFFQKTVNQQPLVILRDMIVFVELNPATHQKIVSPYANKIITAHRYVPTYALNNGGNIQQFPIPTEYKQAFSSALRIPKKATEHERDIYNYINKSLEVGVMKQNYTAYFHNLLWYEETITKQYLKKYNMRAVPLALIAPGKYELYVPGLAEKRPSLMKNDIVRVKPLYTSESVLYEGVVINIEDNTAHIAKFDVEFQSIYQAEGSFDISFKMGREPLERMHLAISKYETDGLNRLVFPSVNPDPHSEIAIKRWMNPLIGANPEQRAAVEHIVRGSAGLAPYILHGPPGTGKTVTIVEAILQLLKLNQRNRILVCTESNMAADNVACMLIQHSNQFEKNFLVRANSKTRDISNLPIALEPFSSSFPLTVAKVHTHRVVVTTLSHAAVYKKTENPISHLFIDEAAQASEPACLVPVVALLDRAGSVVLAGDHMQLGPVIISHDAAAKGLDLSLMERLKTTCTLYETEDQNYTVMLRNNFRSHPDILEIPNSLFYENQLVAQAKEDPLSSTDILGHKKHSNALVFHGCSSKEQKIGKSPSCFNDMELQLVQEYIKALTMRHQVLPTDIGVITPYYRQVYRVKNWLLEKNLNAIEVGTVESFQGKEKRVIIISTVRANCGLLDHDAKFKLGFLVDDKRFNVALTRAKAKVIIIGNPMCLEKDEKWKLYMKRCREHSTYFGFNTVIERSNVVKEDLVKFAKKLIRADKNDTKQS